jgi:acyl carrier protein
MDVPQQRELAFRGIISEIGKVGGDFSADADLYTDLGLDSFRMVEVFMEVEKKFGVSISEDDYLGLRSLKSFMALVER